jgi:glycosyltransferase involved in cell wall biosynthesis
MSCAITAIVCTRDRPAYLARALESLVRQTLDADAYEVLVVDNSADGGAAGVGAAFRDRIRHLVYVHEPAPGLGHARNTGLRRARGRFVAYLDDDAVASPSWLERIVAAFTTVRPAPGCVGGRVDPIWEATRPPWLTDAMLPYLTVIDWSPTATALDDSRYLAGTNMAFPRDVLLGVEGFHPALSRQAAGLLTNDELRVEQELRRRGFSCWYDPAIVVGHHVSPARLTRRYFRRRYFWQGVSDANLLLLDGTHGRGARLRRALGHAWMRLLRPATTAFHGRCEALRDLGYAAGLLKGPPPDA